MRIDLKKQLNVWDGSSASVTVLMLQVYLEALHTMIG